MVPAVADPLPREPAAGAGAAPARTPGTQVEPERRRLPDGPLDVVHAFWLAGMSCDGCTISVAGATNPSVEDLLRGTLPGLPRIELHHPVLSLEAGETFVDDFRRAAAGELDDPYVIIYEGSIADESIAARTGGYFAAMGVEENGDGPRPVPTREWLERMAPGAAAVFAIGTCATWGGIPAATGNPTNAMSVMDHLGEGYRSAFGLPVINVPGCAPVGDNFTETVAAVLLFLQGIGPIPEFDALGRPAWLFTETVHHGCTRAGYYEEGVFADAYGDKECLVEVGCWGPVVNCNIVRRGAQNRHGGCMAAGGVCIGCTMPGFPDRFSPFYKTPPGSLVSSNAARVLGSVMRRLRALSNEHLNREPRWDVTGDVPSGWDHVREPQLFRHAIHFFYSLWQHWGAEKPGRPEGDEAYPTSRPGREEDYPLG